ncbi:hypothetical protein PCANC_09213 [Puccinia coronata f. sp. avenae]|nr:hypothetical protein PCANC_09213 [Puccinia coronata f. sp. avenae]
MPSHYHHPPPSRRDSHSDRRRHVIPFGHPYSCTPILNAIFEFNPSPSHSEVTKIIQQTGLRRKQITSWFWRKRKEAIHPEADELKRVQFPKRSSSHPDQVATSSLPLTQNTRYGKPRDEHDDEYRPPSYIKTERRSHNRSADLELAPSSEPSEAESTLTHEQRVRTIRGLQNRASINSNPSLTSAAQSQSASSYHISSPDRPPVLIRCRLRPLAQRRLNETAEWEGDESNASNHTQPQGGSSAGSSVFLSDIKSHLPPQNNELLDPILRAPSNENRYGLSIESYGYGAVLSSARSLRRNGSGEIACDLGGTSQSPYTVPIKSDDSHVMAEETRLAPASSSPASPKNFSQHTQNDVIIPKINLTYPGPSPVNNLYNSRGDMYRCQLGLSMASRVPEYPVSAARLMGAGKTGWLRSDRRLSYSGSGQVESISRNNSNTFREPSLDSTDSGSLTQTEAGQGICLRVSQEDLDLGSSSNLSMSSLGHEVHRWSELSEVDGASRYSSVSMESRASFCTNPGIEDYSALLNTSSDKVMMCTSPSAREELEEIKESMEFEGVHSAKNFSIATRSISHPYYPLEQTSKTSPAFQENRELSFPPTTCLTTQDLEVEEDPRLFMVQGDHQDFFDLLDWNPLGSFPNDAA